MSSFVSSRREFVSGVSGRKTASSDGYRVNGFAVLALLAGMALMAIGLAVNVTPVFAVGSLSFICSFLYLNSMFWAKWMDKTNYQPTSFRGYHL